MAVRLQDLPEHTQASLLGAPDKPKKPSKASRIAGDFDFQLRSHMFAGWTREHRFAQDIKSLDGKPRQWRFDFAHVGLKLAIEIEGLVVRKVGDQFVVSGRHATIGGFKEDCVKYANAAVLGWYVMRFEQSQVRSGEAIDFVENWYGVRGIDRKFVK